MIGDRIKEARMALGYSAEQVAAFLHVSPATIYRYENGDISKLPSKFIKPLADYLCVSPEYLMGWTDEKPDSAEYKPKNDDVRLLVRGFNQFTPDEIEKAKAMMRLVFANHAEFFEEGNSDDT